MQFRSLMLLGFGAGLMLSSSAYAAPRVPEAPAPDAAAVVETAPVVQVASKAEQEAVKKKNAAAAKKAQAAEQKKAAQAKAAKAKAEKAEQAKQAKAKADKEKQVAAAKAEREKKAAAIKAEREKKIAAAKSDREKKAAEAKLRRDKIAEQRRMQADAKAKETEQRRVARVRAEEARKEQAAAAADAARKAEISRLTSMDVVKVGNNSELRSEGVTTVAPKQTGLFAGLFGGQQVQKQAMLPETRALDAAMEQRASNKPFNVRPEFMPAVVDFRGYKPGTIVIDTAAHRLYLVESAGKARRYAIAVGKEGLQYKGSVKVGDKQEWPRWIPTKEMQQRDPKKYGQYAAGMPGGGANPLGARAIYLHQNGRDTYLRIHGTTAPETIGTNSSNGCFRMINDHVIDLYRRVPVGAEVVVM